MFERFTPEARHAVSLAETEARRLDHGRVGTEHLLLGILAEGGTDAARALVSCGATLDGARSKVAEAVGDDGPRATAGELPMTDRARRALERAARLSLRRRDAYVDTHHVLLSVLDVEGRAGQVLRGLAVDLAALREAVDAPDDDDNGAQSPSSSASVDQQPHTEQVSPRCAACGTPLETSLAARTVRASAEDGTVREFLIAYCASCGSALGASDAGPGSGNATPSRALGRH